MSPDPAQFMPALERAQLHRELRGLLHERVARGEVSVLELLAHPPACAATAQIEQVLTWGPRMWKCGARKILRNANVDGHRRLRDLTKHERLRIEIQLRKRAPACWERWQEAMA